MAFKARATPWQTAPAWPVKPPPLTVTDDVQPVAHLDGDERADDGVAVLVLGEVVLERPAVDGDLAGALGHADAGHGGLSPAGAQVSRFFLRKTGGRVLLDVGTAGGGRLNVHELSPRSGGHLELLRLLGLVRMLAALVDLQLGHLLPAEPVARHHALDGRTPGCDRDASPASRAPTASFSPPG